MTGAAILRQVYGLLEEKERQATSQGDEQGLMAINQIYSELWYREHRSAFVPLEHLRQSIHLSWRCLPAMAYGTAMLLCLNDENRDYTRFQRLYERAASHTGGPYSIRRDVLFNGYKKTPGL